MILAIDIGGTKTLIALCTKQGIIKQSVKFPTPKTYKEFVSALSTNPKDFTEKFDIIVVAAPGRVNRTEGIAEIFGNLPWKHVPLAKDLAKITGINKILIENDANLAAIYAAHTVKPLPHKALYITISTGIGTGLVTDGVLDPDFLDSEGGNILIQHNNQLVSWQSLASGKAIVAKYHKRAADINDPKTWDQISYYFALGIVDLATVLDPDVILIGGGVGTHFKKFTKPLHEHVNKMTPKMVDVPKIIQAPHAEEAVIYGCIELANQTYKK